jgi:hypothetical protein
MNRTNITRKLTATTLAIAAGVLLSACTPPPRPVAPPSTHDRTATPPPTPSARPTPTATASAPAPTIGTTKEDWDGDGPDDPGTVVTVEPSMSADPTRTAAQTRAVEALALFMRRDLTGQARTDALQPYLSVLAARDYASTDPANVPGTTVTGTAQVLSTPSDRIARVQIPTDAGEYVVNLSRNAEDPQWRVERFIVPETNHGEA